jgi:hypothetical protein
VGRNKSVNARASSKYRPKGVWEGRAALVTAEGNRQHPGPDRMLDLLGVGVPSGPGGTSGQTTWNGRDPTWQPSRAKTGRINAGRLKSRGSARESEGFGLPVKARSKTRWREGTLLWSRRLGSKREGMPETAHTPLVKARQLRGPAIAGSQVRPHLEGFGECYDNRSDAPVKGRITTGAGRYARHTQKIVGKPCAGKRHARFERGLWKRADSSRCRAIDYQREQTTAVYTAVPPWTAPLK